MHTAKQRIATKHALFFIYYIWKFTHSWARYHLYDSITRFIIHHYLLHHSRYLSLLNEQRQHRMRGLTTLDHKTFGSSVISPNHSHKCRVPICFWKLIGKSTCCTGSILNQEWGPKGTSGLVLDPGARSCANECQDDLSIFKSILECFSCTFTHKIHHNMPRNAVQAIKKHYIAYTPVTCLHTATVCTFVHEMCRNNAVACAAQSNSHLSIAWHCMTWQHLVFLHKGSCLKSPFFTLEKDFFFQNLLITWKIARKM